VAGRTARSPAKPGLASSTQWCEHMTPSATRSRRINLLQRALPFTTSAAAFGLAVWHRTVYVAGLARGAFAGQSFAGAEGAFAAALSP